MNAPPPIVFIVDDDASVRRSLSRVVRQAGMEPRTFASADEYLAQQRKPLVHPACLLLDLQMPGLGGLELQEKLAARDMSCPVVFISGNGDIPSTVRAMRQGAVTFLTKPFDKHDLLNAISEALENHRVALEANSRVSGIRARLHELTAREREVMSWVLTGSLNKQIAANLGIAEKTVKVHRARVMAKMGVVSVAELVRLCVRAGFAAAE